MSWCRQLLSSNCNLSLHWATKGALIAARRIFRCGVNHSLQTDCPSSAKADPTSLRLVTRNQRDFELPGLEVINPWNSN